MVEYRTCNAAVIRSNRIGGSPARVVEWQTRSTQNRMPQGVRVRLPSWVLHKNYDTIKVKELPRSY